MTKRSFIFIIMFAVLMALALLNVGIGTQAYADVGASTKFAVQIRGAAGQVFSHETGCTYDCTFNETIASPFTKLYYTAYAVDIGNNLSVDDDGNYTDDVLLDDDGNEIKNIEVPRSEWNKLSENLSSGTRKFGFSLVVKDVSAYVFTVEWDVDGESQPQQEECYVLYCTSIDCSPPYVAISEGPVYRNEAYNYTLRVLGNDTSIVDNGRSSFSGLKEVRVFRILNSEEEEVLKITSFTNPNSAQYVDVPVVKGTYYVCVTDGAGNYTTKRIASIDYDIGETIIIENAETVIENSALYLPSIYDEFSEKYYTWQVLALDKNSTQAQVAEAKSAATVALNAVLQAKEAYETGKSHSYEIKNQESFPGVLTVENFNSSSYPNILIGETAVMTISLAGFRTEDLTLKDFTSRDDVKEKGRVLALDISVSRSYAEEQSVVLNENVDIKIPSKLMKDVVAYARIVDGEKVTYERVDMDMTTELVILHVRNSNKRIFLAYNTDEVNDGNGAGNKKLLWLLTLLVIPAVGVPVTLIIVKKKKAVSAEKR